MMMQNDILLFESDNSKIFYREQNELGKPSVIKVLKNEYPEPQSLKHFQGELDLTQQLNVQGIRKSYRRLMYQGRYALEMEYINGKSIKSLLSEKKKFETSEILAIACQMADILVAIHAKQIIHKDINGNNILVNDAQNITLIDFGISTRIEFRSVNLKSPEKLEGTLTHISPEQTGRVNRTLDQRSDLYSFGILLYEMFIGHPPFHSEDAMELVHAHIAKVPNPLHQIDSKIPIALSKIVSVLLAKNADERYQNAVGLKKDLDFCLENFKKNGTIPNFELNTHLISNKLTIPDKLYGREKEKEKLLQAFQNIVEGGVQMMLVGGYSGIGKSALIHEIHSPITIQKGYFASGKFEQLQSGIPYSAFKLAFNEWIETILTESPKNIEQWKKDILEAVGDVGGVLTELVPNLELIIGKQAETDKLGGSESQNRLNYVIQNFVRAICEHSPLVLFIDDLQWADIPSLNLLYSLLTDEKNSRFLAICAYRNNEVDEAHPFIRKVKELEDKKVIIEQIILKRLETKNIEEMLFDSLHQEKNQVKELADILYQKTGGNAFFVRQFLEVIHEDQLLFFESSSHTWQWKTDAIRQLNVTDNVADWVEKRLLRYPKTTQNILHNAACIGNRFDLKTLAIVSENTEIGVADALDVLLTDQLIVPLTEYLKPVEGALQEQEITFKFLHDKVQQAAYQLENKKNRSKNHLKIANLLQKNLLEEERNERIFDIVNHINFGQELIKSDKEIDNLIRLNLEAGKKAILSTAYIPALNYLKNAFEVLEQGVNNWENRYELTLDIYQTYAESAYLTSDYGLAENLFSKIIELAQKPIEKARAYDILIIAKTNKAEYLEAIELGKIVLNLLNVPLPEGDLMGIFMEMVNQIKEQMGDKPIDSLIDLPATQNEEIKIAMKILLNIDAPAYFTNPVLYMVISGHAFLLSLKHGNAPDSAKAYANYGVLVQVIFAQYQEGYELNLAAIHLSDKFKNYSMKGKCLNQIANWTQPWVSTYAEAQIRNKECFGVCMQGGDLQYAAYSLTENTGFSFMMGETVESVLRSAEATIIFANKNSNSLIICDSTGHKIVSKNLLAETSSETDFSIENMTEDQLAETCKKENSNFALADFRITQLFALSVYGLWDRALICAEEGIGLLPFVMGMQFVPLHTFLHTLVALKNYPKVSIEKQTELLELIEKNIAQYEKWAEVAPFNLEQRLFLLKAEKYAISETPYLAVEWYQKAIISAKKAGFIHEEALIHEQTGLFWKKQGAEIYSELHLDSAYAAYKAWGAKRKLFLMGNRNKKASTHTAHATVMQSRQSTFFTTSSTTGSIDISTILKASQTLSREIQLSSLLQKMMQILIENAGADKGILILEKNKEWFIEAESYANSQEIKVLHALPLTQAKHLISSKVINYVSHSKKTLVLHNAAKEGNLIEAQYVQDYHIKSVLSLPILNQGKLIGILYLENSLVEGAFSADRVELLSTLVSQVAISIENALLYENLEQKVQERTKQLKDALGDIHASINYAKRIQTAILPVSQKISEVLPEHFIYFKPKDVVSGDFYWFAHKKDEQIDLSILTAIDCTGHGVPGAFMSMIGDATLNQIVHDQEIHRPDLILNEMHKRIQNTLNQNEASVRDGMDMALISIDHQQNIMSFAGAMNPFYYVKNGEFVEIKADKQAIGGASSKQERSFTFHNIPIDSEITFYLCSDGYQDQFGGADIRKFMVKKLRELLFSIHHLPMEEQKQILSDSMYDWKHQDSLSQTDDILVIGAKIG